jgi:endothelin-converting enzyme
MVIFAQAKAIRVKIGYPTSPDTMDASALEQYYKIQEPFEAHDHFGNVLRSLEAAVKRTYAKIGANVDPGEWEMIP